MSSNIENILGNHPQSLSEKVNAYFDDQKSPVSTALAELVHLIGFPYHLTIDWQSIREGPHYEELDDEKLIDLVCNSTHNFLSTLTRLLEEDEGSFSEGFIELTKPGGRTISVLLNAHSPVPFSRWKEDASSPTIELHLPGKVENSAALQQIATSCGKDLDQILTGLSEFDPLRKLKLQDSKITSALPLVKDLPRPEIALSKAESIYIRIIERMSEAGSRGEGFDIEGYPPVVSLLGDYIFKHANNRYHMDFECWGRLYRLGKGVKMLRVSDSNTSTYLSPLVIIALLEGPELGFRRVAEPLAVGTRLIWLFQRNGSFDVL